MVVALDCFASLAMTKKARPAEAGRAFLSTQRSYVEYLNSGIAFSSSLVALNTAWSGYQGFGFETTAGVVVAAPVVVPVAGLVPGAGAHAPAYTTG